MRTKSLVAAGVIAMACGAAAAMAQTPDQVLGYLDKDGDGKVSLNEYLAYQVTKFGPADTSGDGVLSMAEFKETLVGPSKINAQRSFDTFNTEEDRRNLTQREFLGYHAFVFKTYIDIDHDGFMSADEWAKLMKARQ
jgi:EF hand